MSKDNGTENLCENCGAKFNAKLDVCPNCGRVRDTGKKKNTLNANLSPVADTQKGKVQIVVVIAGFLLAAALIIAVFCLAKKSDSSGPPAAQRSAYSAALEPSTSEIMSSSHSVENAKTDLAGSSSTKARAESSAAIQKSTGSQKENPALSELLKKDTWILTGYRNSDTYEYNFFSNGKYTAQALSSGNPHSGNYTIVENILTLTESHENNVLEYDTVQDCFVSKNVQCIVEQAYVDANGIYHAEKFEYCKLMTEKDYKNQN